MKLSRRLIPAFAMLMVSAVLMSTASFAWFSMNTQVTATDMVLTADAPESLLISNTSATTGYGATVRLESDPAVADVIEPITPFKNDGTYQQQFYKLTPAGKQLVGLDGQIPGNPDVTSNSYELSSTVDGKNNYFHDQIWLKLESSDTKTITVTAAKVSGTSEKIQDAFHVLIVLSETNTVLADIDMGESEGVETPVTLTGFSLNGQATEGTALDVYFYLEGRDGDCTNANIRADADMNVTLTFGLGTIVQ